MNHWLTNNSENIIVIDSMTMHNDGYSTKITTYELTEKQYSTLLLKYQGLTYVPEPDIADRYR